MGGTFARSWRLMSQSWGIIRQDKALLLFPVMSSVACLAVLLSFVIPVVLLVDWRGQFDGHGPAKAQAFQNVATYIVLFAFYFVNYFAIIFFNTALVSCALMRFTGGAPTIGDGLRTACARLPQIAGWALLSATVGMVLKMLEERLSFLGKIIVWFIGTAWSIAAYFVIPVLAAEKVGPIDAVRRSASLLRKSWGESLTGGVSLGIMSIIIAIPGILLIAVGVALAAAGHGAPIFVGISLMILGVLFLIGAAIVTSTLQQIFLAGVYLYAAEGRVADGFSEDTLISAFKVK